MNLSQVAGRSREVNAARNFSLPREDSGPNDARTSSALPWKPTIFGRLRAAFRGQQHHVIEALVRLSGPDGQCWVSMETLAREARVDVKTARKHVHELMRAGAFLRAESMTWAQLCANRRAAGRPVPRMDNDRNAPYLFTVLDGVGRRASELPEVERSQRFATRLGRPPRRAQGERRPVTVEPKTSGFVKVEGYQPWQVRGVPTVVTDLSDDPSDQEKSVKVPTSGTLVGQHTFLVEASTGEVGGWAGAWEGLVAAYGKHFQGVYNAAPTSPRRLKPTDAREAGEHVAQKARALAERLSILEHEALSKLTDRTLSIWLNRKGTGDFLVRAGHPLWALCDELPARVNEAFTALVRDHVATTKPKAPEKPSQSTATWEEIDAARRQAVGQFLGGSSKVVSRPDLRPVAEKPVEVAPVEGKPTEASSDKPEAKAERAKPPRPAPPRINEALPTPTRPESVRSGPRWGEVRRPMGARVVRSVNSTDEPDEPVPLE